MDLIYPIVDHIISVQFNSIPLNAISNTKKFILDTIGVTIAGCRAQGIFPAYEIIKDWGGKRESTVIVFGDKIPSIHAAFINSAMSHALEFDDTHDKAVLHSFTSVLPTALSISESIGNVTGKNFITAVTIGVDLVCRLGLASSTPPRFIRSATCGLFGAIAAAGKLLGFEKETMLNALGIGYSLLSGNEQCAIDGGLTKRMQPGFVAKAAVLSCFLAKKGITGAKDVFEGIYGYFHLYENGRYDPKKITEGLGESFEVDSLSVKPYPCCRASHSAIDGILEIIKENRIDPKDVKEIHVSTSHLVFNLVGRPYVIRRDPHVDAQFSLPYVVSIAILRGRVSLEEFEDQNLMDPDVLELSKKVRIQVVDQLKDGGLVAPCKIEIRMSDGKKIVKQVKVMKGHPENPLSSEELEEKFKNCIRYAQKPKIEKTTNRIIRMLNQLEEIEDVNQLTGLLVERDGI